MGLLSFNFFSDYYEDLDGVRLAQDPGISTSNMTSKTPVTIGPQGKQNFAHVRLPQVPGCPESNVQSDAEYEPPITTKPKAKPSSQTNLGPVPGSSAPNVLSDAEYEMPIATSANKNQSPPYVALNSVPGSSPATNAQNDAEYDYATREQLNEQGSPNDPSLKASGDTANYLVLRP